MLYSSSYKDENNGNNFEMSPDIKKKVKVIGASLRSQEFSDDQHFNESSEKRGFSEYHQQDPINNTIIEIKDDNRNGQLFGSQTNNTKSQYNGRTSINTNTKPLAINLKAMRRTSQNSTLKSNT